MATKKTKAAAKTAAPRLPLERVWQPRKTCGVPICVLDFRVALHTILQRVSEFASVLDLESKLPALTELEQQLDEPGQAAIRQSHMSRLVLEHELWPMFARASWALRLMRGPDMLPRAQYRVIVVDDNKKLIVTVPETDAGDLDNTEATTQACYWRTVQLPSYKGNRPRSRDLLFGELVRIGQELVSELGLPFYSEPLYEADDWAGLIHRLKKAAEPGSLLAERELYYSTVDSDWLQLCCDRTRQYWANTGPWPSRLKDEAETRAYVLKRMGRIIEHPSEIAKVKQLCGDSADNLEVGSDLALFDLCNAHSDYDLSKLDSAKGLLGDLESPLSNTRSDVLAKSLAWLQANGLPISISS